GRDVALEKADDTDRPARVEVAVGLLRHGLRDADGLLAPRQSVAEAADVGETQGEPDSRHDRRRQPHTEALAHPIARELLDGALQDLDPARGVATGMTRLAEEEGGHDSQSEVLFRFGDGEGALGLRHGWHGIARGPREMRLEPDHPALAAPVGYRVRE